MLYRKYYEAIYRFCFRMLGNHENAMDITQETFIKLYERIKGHVSEIENTRAWLYKVAGNLCLNALNTKSHQSEIRNRIENQSIDHSTPEKILLEIEKTRMLKNVLAQLTPKNQLLIFMYQDGLSYKEMSAGTGIKLNSLGKTLWRIIDQISETVKLKIDE